MMNSKLLWSEGKAVTSIEVLASWFRLKYPHIALGALASSASILYFDNITPQNGYYSIVSKDFKLNDSFELKDYLNFEYSSAAQYNGPPSYPVTIICEGIDGAPKGSHVLDHIHAGIVAYEGNLSCYNTIYTPSESDMGWAWQTCSEMVMPLGRGENDTMFFSAPFDLDEFMKECKNEYGVSPRPHWITTYYGGHDIKFILRKFASNIIFSNGLRDPYSSGGSSSSRYTRVPPVPLSQPFEEEVGVGAHDMDYVEVQENYNIEEENKVDAVDLNEGDENSETPAIENANIRSESVNLPSRSPRARKTTSIA
ncbi:hypothetical protein BC332_28719 [Capsicum chinense]|nr:hypothetical protein BC332_28719 [Capsicum chinense]